MKHKAIWIGVVIAVIGISSYWWIGGDEAVLYDLAKVTRQDISQEVSVTGRVVAADEVDLAFDRSGLVAQVWVKVGDRVGRGEGLAKLNDTELSAQLSEAAARLVSEEARLAQLERGTRAEEVAIAETSLSNAYLPVPDILEDAESNIEDVLYKQVDLIFDNDDTNPVVSFNTAAAQDKIDAQVKRLEAKNILDELRAEVEELDSSDQGEMDSLLGSTKVKLGEVDDFLAIVLRVVDKAVGLSETVVTTYKGNVNTARTNVQGDIGSITSQQKTIASAKQELNLKLAGSTAEDIEIQRAAVEQNRAAVERIEAQLEQTTIYTPIGGVVVGREIEPGEFVAAGVTVISVINDARIEIEANIPEVDIAGVKTGDKARVTLDAFGSFEEFIATVVRIDPAETVIEGVSTYKTTLVFDELDKRIKSGMTANIDITTEEREGVLAIPYRAVQRDDGREYVRMKPAIAGQEPEERDITTGLRGVDGQVEILEGLNEGEEVITFERNG